MEDTMKARYSLSLAVPFIALVLVGCSGGSTGKQAVDKEKEYDVKGKVVAVDPDKSVVRLDHEDIPGLMSAMTMNFNVTDKKLLEGLKPGDEVKGRLKKTEAGYTLTHLEKR
jgi:protein SCO1/2